MMGWFLKYRYWLVGFAVIVLLGFRTYNNLWTGDFWEHSSVIRELATHPMDPLHPQLLSDAPHPFFTPYHLALGLIARLSGYNPVKTLAVAGVFNLILFLVAFYLFIPTITSQNHTAVAFYGILLVLLMWGTTVWNYSGFYHLRALAKIIPYPSMIALDLSLLALAMNSWRQKTGRNGWLLPILLLAATVLLTHPITFIFLATGLATLILNAPGSLWREGFKITAVLSLSVFLAAFWPYYPFNQLFMSDSAVFHALNRVMYTNILLKVWPLLIGVPLLIYDSVRCKWRQPVLWWFLALMLVYLFGWVSDAYSYGRVISYAGLLLQITIAIYLARFERVVARKFSFPGLGATLFAITFALLLMLASYKWFLSPVFESALPQQRNRLGRYNFLTNLTEQYDVILTPLENSLVVPTYGGKVVSYDRPQPFIPDDAQRRIDVLRFFDESATDQERSAILTKYSVKFILLDRLDLEDWHAVRNHLGEFSRLIYFGTRYSLHQVEPAVP